MTGQPDVAGAVLALDRAMIALAVAKSTLLGETSMPLDPYGSTKHGVFGGSAAEVAEGVEPGRPEGCICIRFRDTGGFRIADLTCPVHGLGGTQPGDGPWEPSAPTGHLPQHTHGQPGCTYCGKDHAAVTR